MLERGRRGISHVIKFSWSLAMGCCLPCLSGPSEDAVDQPDPETRRRQQAEAAERRQKELDSKGIKDPEALKRKQQRAEAAAQSVQTQPQGGGGLTWQVG